jgi:hypothetical protein
MSNCPFCNVDPAPERSAAKRPSALFRRARRSVQWLFPAALLVLMPKCPMCIVGYVALSTGIGITVSTARCIQVLMLAFCVIALAYLVVKHNPFFQKNPRLPARENDADRT